MFLEDISAASGDLSWTRRAPSSPCSMRPGSRTALSGHSSRARRTKPRASAGFHTPAVGSQHCLTSIRVGSRVPGSGSSKEAAKKPRDSTHAGRTMGKMESRGCRLTPNAVVVHAAPPRTGRRSRNGDGCSRTGRKAEYGVCGSKLTLDAAVVEAAAPRNGGSRSGDQAGSAGRESRRRRLTPNAVVVEAAPPRTEKRSRTGDGELRPKLKDEIRSRRAKLTLDAVVVEATAPRSGEVALATKRRRGKKRVDEAS
jgi:hypothetical protein